MEDRLVPLVDLGVAGDPRPHRCPAHGIEGERVQRLRRRAELAVHLPGEVPEHVLLAREVLVEGNPRAPSELRDPVDAAGVISALPESSQGRVENALLRPLPPCANLGVVGERRPADGGGGSAEALGRGSRRGHRGVTLPLVSLRRELQLGARRNSRCYGSVTRPLVSVAQAGRAPEGEHRRWSTDRSARRASRSPPWGSAAGRWPATTGPSKRPTSPGPSAVGSTSASTASTRPRGTAWACRSGRSARPWAGGATRPSSSRSSA